MIGRGQRVAVMTVTSFEMTFEIDAPEMASLNREFEPKEWLYSFDSTCRKSN
jgi:hypothetical protein